MGSWSNCRRDTAGAMVYVYGVEIATPSMTTDLFHVVNALHSDMEYLPDYEVEKGRWFWTRQAAEAHAEALSEVMGYACHYWVLTTSECRAIGI